jgi:hypothetical protein
MATTDIPEKTKRFRIEHRAAAISPSYDGRLHFAMLNVVLIGIVTVAITQLASPSLVEWATVPVTFLIANVAEYFGHRYPMHHAMWPLEKMCHRHAGLHHRFYTHVAMSADSPRDWSTVLFPPILLFFFLGVIATPLGILIFVVASSNAGFLFVATAASYFLLYEWLHLSYHQPDDSVVGRLGIVRVLRRHHQLHHDPSKMTRVNFNITFPVCDVVFGTMGSRSDRKRAGGDESESGAEPQTQE